MTWRATARVAILTSLVGWPLAVACGGGSTNGPAGSGDDFADDTRADAQADPVTPPPEDAGPDAPQNPNAYEDAGDDGGIAASYPGLAECDNCFCNPDKNFCFGGAPVRAGALFTPLAASDAGSSGDGGQPACLIVDASAPQLGCNPYPTGCNDCACTINALAPLYTCELRCAANAVGQPVTVYCDY